MLAGSRMVPGEEIRSVDVQLIGISHKIDKFTVIFFKVNVCCSIEHKLLEHNLNHTRTTEVTSYIRIDSKYEVLL